MFQILKEEYFLFLIRQIIWDRVFDRLMEVYEYNFFTNVGLYLEYFFGIHLPIIRSDYTELEYIIHIWIEFDKLAAGLIDWQIIPMNVTDRIMPHKYRNLENVNSTSSEITERKSTQIIWKKKKGNSSFSEMSHHLNLQICQFDLLFFTASLKYLRTLFWFFIR